MVIPIKELKEVENLKKQKYIKARKNLNSDLLELKQPYKESINTAMNFNKSLLSSNDSDPTDIFNDTKQGFKTIKPAVESMSGIIHDPSNKMLITDNLSNSIDLTKHPSVPPMTLEGERKLKKANKIKEDWVTTYGSNLPKLDKFKIKCDLDTKRRNDEPKYPKDENPK